jgi:hypothetical protein
LIPDGITLSIPLKVSMTVDVKVYCDKCGVKSQRTYPFTFSVTVSVSYSITGLEAVADIVGSAIPGANVLIWVNQAYKIYQQYKKLEAVYNQIKAAWKGYQTLVAEYRAIKNCDFSQKRAIEAVRELVLDPATHKKIVEHLKVPENWQQDAARKKIHEDVSALPPHLCDLAPAVLKVKDKNPERGVPRYCVCHDHKGIKRVGASCDHMDRAPPQISGNQTWTGIPCVPVNCYKQRANSKSLDLELGVPLASYSDIEAESVQKSLNDQLGSPQLAIIVSVDVANHSDATVVKVDVREEAVPTVRRLNKLTSSQGTMLEARVVERSNSTGSGLDASFTKSPPFFIIIAVSALVVVVAVVLAVVLVRKRSQGSSKDEMNADGDVRYIRA